MMLKLRRLHVEGPLILYLNAFSVVAYDPMVDSNSKVQLPIDVNEFAQQLAAQHPSGEVFVDRDREDVTVTLYETTREEWWKVAAHLDVGKPMSLSTSFGVFPHTHNRALQLILWFRKYITAEQPLFLVAHRTGKTIELSEYTPEEDLKTFLALN